VAKASTFLNIGKCIRVYYQSLCTANKPGLLPSEALLEFLVEFENIDDETFNLLIQRGQKDVETSKQDDKEASAKALDGGIGNE